MLPDNPSMIESKNILERHHPNLRLLGTGDESFVFTDDANVYKFFNIDTEYYSHIGRQIRGRFEGCKHLYDVSHEVLEGHTVFIYDYEPSRSYTGGMETDLIEMMSEFALCGVACKDIKPNNLRITPSGLKFIDYGHDLIPYNESDFVSMCLRAFLCMKHWANPQFIRFAQITSYTWNSEHTGAFINFFNKVYSRYLEKRQTVSPPVFRMPSNRWMDNIIMKYYSDNTIVYCISDMSEELFVKKVSAIDDISSSSDIFLISGNLEMPDSLAERIKCALEYGRSVHTIVPNPFFNGGFTKYKELLESKGMYPDILAHSDPVPSSEGLESKFILLELNSAPTEKRQYVVPPRNEDYIFVICGRNVPPRIYLRCWNSVENLRCGRWGAIIVDDASDDADIDLLIGSTACLHERVTYIRNKERRSILPNIVDSIKNVCTNPNSVIITLDMDDALLSRDALCMIRSEYLRGHDMVSSTCLKKGVRILPYEIDYNNVRNSNAGDVWMHIRSFRKYLFDNICESDFKENDNWIEVFNELTFMVPIAEMASDPVQIRVPIYLWEPRTIDDDAHIAADAHTKELVTSRKPYPKFVIPRVLGEIRPPGMLIKDFQEGDILIIRHAEKENRTDYLSAERGITERGERESRLFGSCLKHIDLYLCSEIRRTAETAYCMNEGNGSTFELITDPMLNSVRYDYNVWLDLKKKYGYLGIMRKWRNNEFTHGELPDFKDYSTKILHKMLELSKGRTVCVVTHDHVVCFLSTIFKECTDSRVPYMGGFVLKRSDISNLLEK